MRIAVCIKQVPNTMEVTIDNEKGSLIRKGVPYILNPFDLVAIEAALRIKEMNKTGKVISLTMGPSTSEEVLKQSFMMGVDKGVLLNDSKFSGADVLATSYTLAKGIKLLENIDIIICGKQTLDGDTSQVGQALGEHLGISHIYNVKEVKEIKLKSIVVIQETEKEYLVIEIKTPCVLIMSKDSYKPRIPNLKMKLEAKKKDIIRYTAQDFKDSELDMVGLKGSSTRVKKCFTVSEKSRSNSKIYKDNEFRMTEILYENLNKFLKRE